MGALLIGLSIVAVVAAIAAYVQQEIILRRRRKAVDKYLEEWIEGRRNARSNASRSD